MDSFLKRHLPTVHAAARAMGKGRFEVFPPRRVFALGSLHEAIKARFGFRDGVYFEVGANDGLEQSNTAYLGRYLGWRGILVEAIPHKFVACVQNRPLDHVYHAALVPFEYTAQTVELSYSNLMSVSDLTQIDTTAHLEIGAQFLGIEKSLSSQIFYAPARTAQSVIRESGFSRIDLFSLDVEGAEFAVLGGIDFQDIRPRHFLIEANQPDAMHEFMKERGYTLLEQLTFHDFLYRDMSDGALG